MNTVLHIVPRVPPAIDGIADYSVALGRELEERFGTRSEFLAMGPEDPGIANANILASRTSRALEEHLRCSQFSSVVLHYSGYGFHPRGTPIWLVQGLQRFRAAHSTPIITFFHELWASGKPWETTFYLHPLQRFIVRQLAALSNQIATSNLHMARLLQPSRAAIEVIPIPSSLPETQIPAVRGNSDQLRIIVFGQENTRRRTLEAHQALLQRWQELHSVHLTLAGKGAGRTIAEQRWIAAHPGIPTECVSDASAERLQMAMAKADLALSFYPAHLAAKSTSIMSAFACGRAVVVPAANLSLPEDSPPMLYSDGSLNRAQELLRLRLNGELTKAGERSLFWYRENAAWEIVARRFGSLLRLTETLEPALL